jgi:hypothetical protein
VERLNIFTGIKTGGYGDVEKTTLLKWHRIAAKAFRKNQEKILSALVCYLLHQFKLANNHGLCK